MGQSRKEASDRLLELSPQVVHHLEKIRTRPEAWDWNHWRSEVREWLGRMEHVLDRIGKRTRAEWEARIDGWRHELGE